MISYFLETPKPSTDRLLELYHYQELHAGFELGQEESL